MEKATKKQLAAYNDACRIENSVLARVAHACGWLLSKDSLTDYVPLTLYTELESDVTHVMSQYGSYHVEDCGLLKLDLLSLNALATSHLAGTEDLNDRETMELFARGDTTGILQFESEGMKKWLRKVNPEKFEHLVALNTMYRPGPMDRIGLYSSLRNGLCEDSDFAGDNPFANLRKYTDETFGMIIYQEQLMSIVSDVAAFSLQDLKRLRKFAGPLKIHRMIDGQRVDVHEYLGKKFIDGGIANGYDRKTLEQFWNGFVRTYNAAYLFSKSHAVCYTLIAYRMAYLKAHNPALFYNSLNSTLSDEEDRKALHDDALQHGFVYMIESEAFYQVLDE